MELLKAAGVALFMTMILVLYCIWPRESYGHYYTDTVTGATRPCTDCHTHPKVDSRR